jgi:hypothetical protein
VLQSGHRNFEEKRLSGAVFLDVAEVFDTEWVDGLLYKVTVLNFLSYFVKTISSYLQVWRSSALPNSHIHLSSHAVWRGLWWNKFPAAFCLYVNDMPSTSHHVTLVLYADERTILTTS